MTLDLTVMRALLRKGLGGLDSADLIDADADQYLNMSLWDISDRFHFKEKECTTPSTLIAGTRAYDLPDTLDALISVSIQDIDSLVWKKLGRMSPHRLDEVMDSSTDAQAKPREYIRKNRKLIVDPIPDLAYPIRLFMFRTVESLLSGSVETTGLPRNWDVLVVEGAITLGHYFNQDYTLARQAANFQVTGIREATLAQGKEEKYDSRYARMRVIDEDPTEG